MPLTDQDKMPFGAHKGKLIADVPASYLLWFYDQSWRMEFQELLMYVEKWKDSLAQEAKRDSEEYFRAKQKTIDWDKR